MSNDKTVTPRLIEGLREPLVSAAASRQRRIVAQRNNRHAEISGNGDTAVRRCGIGINDRQARGLNGAQAGRKPAALVAADHHRSHRCMGCHLRVIQAGGLPGASPQRDTEGRVSETVGRMP